MVNSFRNTLLEVVFPNYCALCGLRSYQSLPLCKPCRSELSPNSTACARCALPLPSSLGPGAICGHCQRDMPPFKRVVAPWLYSEYAAHMIGRWKFHREERLTQVLADLWLEKAELSSTVDLLVPIPLHWRRKWERGYNQAELLAHELLKRKQGIASEGVDTRLLHKARATQAQAGMGARARTANLRDAFTVKRPCDNLRIAVVDDVFTTGATASAAARALLAAGAHEVEIWCLARTPAPYD